MNTSKSWDKISEAERAKKVLEEFDRCGIEYSFGPGGIQFDGFVPSQTNTDHYSEQRRLRMDVLKDIATKDLVEELQEREGVDTFIVQPHEMKDFVNIEGPAIVLLVYD